MISEYLGLDRNAGLTTALVGGTDINHLLQPWGEDNMFVLSSGQIPPNPSELLGSASMKDLLVYLEEVFDAVIIDAPPLLPVTDAAVLAQSVGGTMLVAGSHKLKLQDLRKSLTALELVGSNLLGVVLNRLPAKGPDSYAYSYYGDSTSGNANASDNTGEITRDQDTYKSDDRREPATFPSELRSKNLH
jgi:capsular exopolysaccharide synthesis family protein